MIEIRPKREEVIVDDEVFKGSGIYIHWERGGIYTLSIHQNDLIRKLAAVRFSDLPKECKTLRLNRFFESFNDIEIQRLRVIVYKSDLGKFKINLNLYFDVSNWKHLWSIKEYVEEFRHYIKSNNEIEVNPLEVRFISAPGISITSPVKDSEASIETEVSNLMSHIRELHKSIEMVLMTKLRSESVVMSFDFPEEVRVPCEQYLLYFVQFLKDLGVEATAEIQHEAGQVLFAVTPKDKEEALDKIRTALEAYLRLAGSNIRGGDNNVMLQRLTGNIYHLKSQLALSQALIQAKDAAIQAQQTTIINQQRLLSGEIIVDSLKNVTPKAEDNEELLGGRVIIKKYEGKGFDVD